MEPIDEAAGGRELGQVAKTICEQVQDQFSFLEIISGGHPAVARAKREVEVSLAWMIRELGGQSGEELAA
jgi:hypothetical protein